MRNMSKIFTEAHRITRGMVEEYGMDYRAQFAITLSYLLNNKEEELEPKKLVKQLLYQDGSINNNWKEYKELTLWEKYGHRRLYVNDYNKGSYVCLLTNMVVDGRTKEKIGEWIETNPYSGATATAYRWVVA